MRYKKYILLICAAFVFMIQPVMAAGEPSKSLFDSTLAVSLLSLMGLLLIVIAVLANMMIGAAHIRVKRRKQNQAANPGTQAVLLLLLILCGTPLFAQNTDVKTNSVATIGDLASGTFYIMISIIFLELIVILTLLFNIRMLIRTERGQPALEGLTPEQVKEVKRNSLSWWDRINKLRPVSQEAQLDLGHEYDGIRELNNRLPPWWIYGFYVTILFAGIYLWRFHVSHKGPSSKEEYEISVTRAEKNIREYVKAKGEAVDENTVTLLTSANDLQEGKAIFVKSCASCHKETGAGDVGPNLTDNYWIHGNNIKNVFKTIRYGINAMPQWQMAYSNKQIAQVASYVKSLQGTNPPNAKAPQGVEMKDEQQKPVADTIRTALLEKTR
jgi:cytochrome c oxidase cbb3-type subunit III